MGKGFGRAAVLFLFVIMFSVGVTYSVYTTQETCNAAQGIWCNKDVLFLQTLIKFVRWPPHRA